MSSPPNPSISEMKGADFGRSPTKQQAALDTEGMSYAQLSANEAAIDADIEEQKRALLNLRHRIDHEEDERQSQETRTLGLEARIQQVRLDLNNAERDWAATVEHATEGMTMIKQDLIDEFLKLLRSIDSLQTWCEGLVGAEKKLVKDQARAILEHLRGEANRQKDIEFVRLAMERSPPLRPIIGCLLRHYLDSVLLAHVFAPLVPGVPADSKKFLSDMRRRVQNRELQSESAQWHCLTYKHTLDMQEENWSAAPASQFHQELINLLHAVDESGQSSHNTVEEAKKIIEDAAEFKSRAMIKCSELDFYVYTTFDDGKFNPGEMREVYPTSRWINWTSLASSSRTILPVGLGLSIRENIQEDSKRVLRYEYPIPASVIGDRSWLLSYGLQLWGSGRRDW